MKPSRYFTWCAGFIRSYQGSTQPHSHLALRIYYPCKRSIPSHGYISSLYLLGLLQSHYYLDLNKMISLPLPSHHHMPNVQSHYTIWKWEASGTDRLITCRTVQELILHYAKKKYDNARQNLALQAIPHLHVEVEAFKGQAPYPLAMWLGLIE